MESIISSKIEFVWPVPLIMLFKLTRYLCGWHVKIVCEVIVGEDAHKKYSWFSTITFIKLLTINNK